MWRCSPIPVQLQYLVSLRFRIVCIVVLKIYQNVVKHVTVFTWPETFESIYALDFEHYLFPAFYSMCSIARLVPIMSQEFHCFSSHWLFFVGEILESCVILRWYNIYSMYYISMNFNLARVFEGMKRPSVSTNIEALITNVYSVLQPVVFVNCFLILSVHTVVLSDCNVLLPFCPYMLDLTHVLLKPTQSRVTVTLCTITCEPAILRW